MAEQDAQHHLQHGAVWCALRQCYNAQLGKRSTLCCIGQQMAMLI